jgi:hypothetical protein
MIRAALDLVQERGPAALSSSTTHTKASTQIGEAANGLPERVARELGTPRGKAKLEGEVVFVKLAGHIKIISRFASSPSRLP